MPSATPVPRGPSRLALFGAEDLLGPVGCPVCQYVAEGSDRFLGWFALEAHAEPGMITRLCRSLGLCPAHTRGLLAQPGAAGRMTAVYGYVLRAAAGYLAGEAAPDAPCPGCAHDREATQRALDTLVTGLREQGVRERYRDGGGLCLPHLRAAAPRAGRRLAAWLAGETITRLAGEPPAPATMAGDQQADADLRVRLRAALPATPAAWGICEPCLAAAHAERDALAQPGAGLCPEHLREIFSGPAGREPPALAARLLEQESARSAAWLAGLTSAAGPRPGFGWLAGRHREPRGGDDHGACPACQAATAGASHALASFPQRVAARPASQGAGLCLRHVMSLRRRDPRGAVPVIRSVTRSAGAVLAELDEAFRKRAWAHRHEPRGPEMTAWRRAAALIDGGVYGGGPPGPLAYY
ncbi:MAG TPA: hypothetical protein VMI33_03150 [Streptosporangiaceae bacterium]|nr:hypothetical protein [Streptosporangiaceae bacterium]